MLARSPIAIQAQDAFTLHQQIVALVRQAETLFLGLGSALLQMRATPGFLEAMHCQSFDEYLSQPELAGLSRRQAYTCMRVARVYLGGNAIDCTPPQAYLVSPQDVAEMGVTKADIIAPFVSPTDPERTEEWVERGKTLAVADLKRLAREEARETPYNAQQQWLEEVAYQLAAVARRLPDAANPLDVLDDLSSRILAVRARLEAYCGGQVGTTLPSGVQQWPMNGEQP